MYISANFSNWHLNHNIFGKRIVLHNRSINPCQEKLNPGQIPISSEEKCFEQLWNQVVGELKSNPQQIPDNFGQNNLY